MQIQINDELYERIKRDPDVRQEFVENDLLTYDDMLRMSKISIERELGKNIRNRIALIQDICLSLDIKYFVTSSKNQTNYETNMKGNNFTLETAKDGSLFISNDNDNTGVPGIIGLF